MDMNDIPTAPRRNGFFTRLCISIAGANEETLKRCPPTDLENIRAVAVITICVWCYQAALFAAIAHKIFAAPGTIRPEFILVACGLATFVLLVDSYMVLRSGWYLSGVEELRRGGLDLGGGIGPRLKAGLFLTIRILLSLGIAQLTAVFLSLLIFSSDIQAHLRGSYLQANGQIIAQATAMTDHDIQRATKAVDVEAERYAELTAQVATARKTQTDPLAGDPQVQQAQKELNDLLTQKAKADDGVVAAEGVVTDELGGVKGPSTSGQPGAGFRHRAALEKLSDVKARADTLMRETDAARARLDGIRNQRGSAGLMTAQQSKEQLPSLEKALADEEGRLNAARDRLTSLTDGRDETIRRSIEKSPGEVPPETGLLAQLTALEEIAGNDPKIKAVVILIDVVSFGFELAAVLSKVTSHVPTTYAALLVADNYRRVVRVVDKLMEAVDGSRDADAEADVLVPENAPEAAASTGSDLDDVFPPKAPDAFGAAAGEPLRRPRGRPRKSALN